MRRSVLLLLLKAEWMSMTMESMQTETKLLVDSIAQAWMVPHSSYQIGVS
jgi:hypothetical protein